VDFGCHLTIVCPINRYGVTALVLANELQDAAIENVRLFPVHRVTRLRHDDRFRVPDPCSQKSQHGESASPVSSSVGTFISSSKANVRPYLDVGRFQIPMNDPCSCAASSASAICFAIGNASSSGIAPRVIRSAIVSPVGNAHSYWQFSQCATVVVALRNSQMNAEEKPL